MNIITVRKTNRQGCDDYLYSFTDGGRTTADLRAGSDAGNAAATVVHVAMSMGGAKIIGPKIIMDMIPEVYK